MKLCKDCKHVRPDAIFRMKFAKCGVTPDPVNGTPRWYCTTERAPMFDAINKCGSQGKLWEPKPPSLLKRVWTWLTWLSA